MYKCRECGTQYKIKPDYCECGNDTFEILMEKSQKQPMTLEQKAETVSWIFFVICLIFAISVWFIPMRSKPVQPKQTPTKVHTETNIPDINKFWNDTPIYQPKREQQTEVITPKEPIKLTPVPVDYARRS